MNSRREFLQTSGALIVGFSLRVHGQAVPGKPLDVRKVDSFLEVRPDGIVHIYCGKIDCGTGLRIAVRQMAAEELGIRVEDTAFTEGDTALSPDQGGTGGSTGLTRGGTEIRQAAATAREALIGLAAKQLNLSSNTLEIVNGEVRPKAGGTGIKIAALVGGKSFATQSDPKAPLKKPADYKLVGQSPARPDVPGKCTGRNAYLQDMVLPGMLHARVVRAPSTGARLVSVDEAPIKSIPGVRVIRQENFLAVVSSDEWAVVRASRELKTTWDEKPSLPGSTEMENYLRKEAPEDKVQVVNQKGNTDAAMASASKKLSATFYWPNQSHASLGPSCSVADVKDGGATVWSSSQATHGLRTNIARLFAFAPEKVRVIYLDGAGSYGTNGCDDAAAEAVLISKLAGAPVRLQWMRHEEHGWDPKGPQQLIDLRAGLDASGALTAWDNEMWVPTTLPGARPLVSIDAAGMNQERGMSSGQITQNGEPPYACANIKVTAHLLKQTPLRPSNLRAPGKIANTWSVEHFVDEIAAAAGVDPVEYRRRGLTDPRAIETMDRCTQLYGWKPRTGPTKPAGRVVTGHGFAYARYKQAENYVAIAMEVAVDKTTGKVTVRRVVCTHDCGLVVNPDALKNQVEGCIVQTLSRALWEETAFDRTRVTTLDWVTYPILRFPDVPKVEVTLISRPDQPLYGAGEAAAAPVAAALANAIFDATGVKMQRVPFTPARVKDMLV